MPLVSIEGYHFNTDRAKDHWALSYWDGSNRHEGDVYLSSDGVFYVFTPSQWSNRHRWEISNASEILSEYDKFLDERSKEEIAAAGGVEWT